MSVAVTGGLFLPVGVERFFVRRVGHEKSKPLPLRMTGSVTRGREGSQLTRSPLWMMMGDLFSLVSGVAGIMIALMWRMLSDMRKGE